MTDETINLPPLPWPEVLDSDGFAVAYLPSSVQAYARAAVLADRARTADMFWDADDPEHPAGGSLHDTICDMMDNAGPEDFPLTVRLQCARRLPDIRVRVTGRNEDDELQYEELEDGHD